MSTSRRRSRRGPNKASGLSKVFLLLVLVALVAGGAWLWQRYTGFADTPLPGLEAGDTLVVERGDSLATVVAHLGTSAAQVGHRLEWQALAKQLGAAGRIQVGEYALEPGTTPRTLLVAMRDGKVISKRFTIVEGWNIRELRAALARNQDLAHETQEMTDAALMSALGHAGQHPEGRFLPETYQFVRGDSDLDVLRRAYAAMERALADAWDARAPDTVLRSADDALILASIVEKETGVADERPQIAGVFARRLKMGMRLQTDPTVIYGMGATYSGNIRRADLLADTPYNTYVRAGLPPTPIAMPGNASLLAAVSPAQSKALYFVARGDGTSHFSANLDEHNRAVNKYQRGQ